jgi:O-acetyl-ADP-ribose deacetylase (regulator of RNase III)
MQTIITGTRLELVEGDITEQDLDAIVNSASPDLLGGSGVDGAIHRKGGIQILNECIRIGGCPIGEAVITSGGRLKARYVIHTVGPVYEEGDDYKADLLVCAYRNSLRVAVEHKLKSVAFPSISTGAFHYPVEEAAPVAVQAIVEFLTKEEHELELVRLVMYPGNPFDIPSYGNALRELTKVDG